MSIPTVPSKDVHQLSYLSSLQYSTNTMRTTTLTATSTSGGGHKVAVLAAGLLAATLTAATDLYVSADVSTDNCSGFPQYSGGLAGPWPVVMDRVNSDLNGDGAYPLSMDDSGGPSVIWVRAHSQEWLGRRATY